MRRILNPSPLNLYCMIGKSLFKKYQNQRENQNRKIPGMIGISKGKGPKVAVVLWPTCDGAEAVEIQCEVDTGCGFLLSLPVEMSEKMKGFERCPEYDRQAEMPNGNEVEHLAFKATVTIAETSIECICHWAVGVDQALLGLPLFLSHFRLEISKKGISITPNKS